MQNSEQTFNEFKGDLEAVFGQPLNDPSSEAAEDFWEHREQFQSLIDQHSLNLSVDALSLSQNFPGYSRYTVWKGAAILGYIIGIIVLFFQWQVGLIIFIGSFGLSYWSKQLKFKDAKSYSETLIQEAQSDSTENGYENICANYIAGIIEIVTPNGSAHWPQYPSNALTGEESYIPTS